MRTIGDCAKDIKKTINELVGNFENGKIDDKDFKAIFDMLNAVDAAKVAIESMAIKCQRGEQVKRALDVYGKEYRDIKNNAKYHPANSVDPNPLASFDPDTDTLHSEQTICDTINVTFPTLHRWRRNWRGHHVSSQYISFPPPVIYVYGSPRWTFRQLTWWLEVNKGKVYIKGLNDDSTGNQ